MKNYKIILLLFIGLVITGCSLEEEAPFLSNENVYGTASDAAGAVDGMYAGVAGYNYFGNQYLFLVNLNSGFTVTRRGGNRNTSVDNTTNASLKPESGTTQLNNGWQGMYSVIARTNDAIQSAVPTDNPTNAEELGINDAIGQAYFLRAFSYFNLVRLWGEVPLRTAPADQSTIHVAKSEIPEIYAQIIEDAKNAQKYMNGAIGNGKALPYAADMLLAKVYMTLATAPADHLPATGDYWQMAYDEAIKVYGQYTLYPSYSDLFIKGLGDNTSESIFELQSSEAASLDHTRAFTPTWYSVANTFGWLKANAEIYDQHVQQYSGDPRVETTYISTWTRQNNGSTERSYPVNANRNSFGNAFPYVLKLGARDQGNSSRETTKNFKVYRYADLLLMLAEISNELQNGEQLGYVTEVLDRVGLTPHSGYLGSQEDFRTAIMKEYQYELLMEGHDWFNNRRRGYDYFLNTVILPHNNYVNFRGNVDVTHETDQTVVMHMPIPIVEINTNQLIND